MKSPTLMYIIDDVRDIHPDESARSVCGRSVRHTSVKLSALSFEKRWDEAWCMYASNHTHAVHYSRHDAGRLLACGTCHEFASSLLRMWICLKTPPASSCPSSTPARTTWMTSAVKTKRVRISSSSAPCPTAGPRRPVLARGRSQESDPDARFEGS